jgi:hypothetical protein
MFGFGAGKKGEDGDQTPAGSQESNWWPTTRPSQFNFNGRNQAGARPPLPTPNHAFQSANVLPLPQFDRELQIVLSSIESSKHWNSMNPSPFFLLLQASANQTAGWLREVLRQPTTTFNRVWLAASEKRTMVDQFTTLEKSMLNYRGEQNEYKKLFAHAWNTTFHHFEYTIRKQVASQAKQTPSRGDFHHDASSLQAPQHYRLQNREGNAATSRQFHNFHNTTIRMGATLNLASSLPPHYRLQNPGSTGRTSQRFQLNAPPTRSVQRTPRSVQRTPVPPPRLIHRFHTPSTDPGIKRLVGRFEQTMARHDPDGSHQSAQKRASESIKIGLKTFRSVCGENYRKEDLLNAFSPPGYSQYRDSTITTWKKKAHVYKRAQEILNADRYTGK